MGTVQLSNNSLSSQLSFLLELDKLKSVLRRSYINKGVRRENSAEHSWHVAVSVMLLAEHANEDIDLMRTMKMMLIHDIVEIDAGDTIVYDNSDEAGKIERERKAAERIFGMLPDDQARELHELWIEFETRDTPEAKFAAAIDRIIPLLHNYHSKGKTWIEYGINAGQVRELNSHIRKGSEMLWNYISDIIDDSVMKGYLTNK